MNTLAMVVSLSSACQFALLPLCGFISDNFGRKPIMILCAALGRALFPLLICLRPSWSIFIAHRLVANLTWMINQTALKALLSDIFEGKQSTRLMKPIVIAWSTLG